MASFSPSAFVASVKKAVNPIALRGLALAGAAMAESIRHRISIQGPPPSEPGRAPHMETGTLHDSIFWEVDPVNMRVYVVADTPYAYYLEYGTSTMAPRPYMRTGLSEFASAQAARYVSLAFAAPRTPVDESLMRTTIH